MLHPYLTLGCLYFKSFALLLYHGEKHSFTKKHHEEDSTITKGFSCLYIQLNVAGTPSSCQVIQVLRFLIF